MTLVMSVGLGLGQELRLASVAGAPDMVYPWPLTVGKGDILLYITSLVLLRERYD